MLRQFVVGSVALALGLGSPADAQTSARLRTQVALNLEPFRAFADRFLDQLDASDIDGAYAMIDPAVRANYSRSELAQAQSQRQGKGPTRRVFVGVRSVPTKGDGPSREPMVVCYTEPPMRGFGSVSYTTVTVSSGRDAMWIENFQITTTPQAVCQ